MYKFLRILFTVLSALCVTAAFIVGAYLDLAWVIASALSAFLFFMLMLLCKQKQEETEKSQSVPTQETKENEK